MESIGMLQEIFKVCIIPILGILTTYFVKYIQKKMSEIQTKIDDETLNKYMEMLTETITNCVIATNQTYVDALKKEGKFDKDAQIIAFNKTKDAVFALLSDEAKKYLTLAYGDLGIFVTQLIEAKVNTNKLDNTEVFTSKNK